MGPLLPRTRTTYTEYDGRLPRTLFAPGRGDGGAQLMLPGSHAASMLWRRGICCCPSDCLCRVS